MEWLKLEKWSVTSAVVVALSLASVGVFLTQGVNEDSLRGLIRYTAVSSLVLFCIVFTASSFQALYRKPWSAWMLRNRRYIGLSFASSHGFHLLFIITLLIEYPEPFLSHLAPATLIGGGVAYLFILAMSITSFKGPRRALGPKLWNLLHTSGSYYIWALFMFSYAPRLAGDTNYLPHVLLLLGALAIRLVKKYKKQLVAHS